MSRRVTVTTEPPTLYCGVAHIHHAIVALEPCGCIAGMSVLDHHEASAYKFAADEAKAGLLVETWTVERVRTAPFHCADHPKGPPWWKSNGGKGKRPAEYQPQVALGL